MKVDWPVEIAGIGMCVPQTIVPNQWFVERLDTTNDWIVQRTGIRERRVAQPGESTLSMAHGSSVGALASAGLTPSDIDLIVNATISPEHPLPSTACELQARLGCGQIPAFDIAAACSGFIYAFITASHMLVSGMASNALAIGVETLTRVTDFEDRSSAVIFGDGAGAALLRRSTAPERRVLAATLGADGHGAMSIFIPAGGSAEPASQKTINERLHFMRMKGREVYKFAVTKMEELIRQTVDEAGVNLDDVALVIPHQSNLRIIESACDKLNLPLSRVLVNIDRFGNTSAASIPMGLVEARDTGRIKRGDLVLMAAFGAGLTWGSVLLRY